ncbi:hypothetical protein [Halomarina rubra]|uniref:Uncharacterized protein n=1 Tax=Halomarina rubra TaxID=2071873 RepID=A0ABD6ATJ0_9EURY|nr:hypothetical protein [Halomarina rubra]
MGRVDRWGRNHPRINAVGGLVVGLVLFVLGVPATLWWVLFGFGLALTVGLLARRLFDWEYSGGDPVDGRGGGVAVTTFSLAMVVELFLLDIPLHPLATVDTGTETVPIGLLWVCVSVMLLVGVLRALAIEVLYLTTSRFRNDSP